MSDGSTVKFRRCGILPDLFASREGDILAAARLQLVEHQGNAIVRHRATSLAVRHLVADAWRPGWQNHFRTVVLEDRNFPLDCSLDNLVFSVDTRRGRPRSTRMHDEILLARCAILTNDISLAADECGVLDQEVLKAVLKWFPDHLVEMDGLPENWLQGKAARDMAARAHAIERRRELNRAEKKAKASRITGEPPPVEKCSSFCSPNEEPCVISEDGKCAARASASAGGES